MESDLENGVYGKGMKSVIAAAILLVFSVCGCLYLSSVTAARIDQLYRMTEKLPEQGELYRDDPAVKAQAVTISDCWSDSVTYFSYVCGYTALNRADEAVWTLYAAMQAEDYASALIARYQLLDALRRMRELEGISLASIF